MKLLKNIFLLSILSLLACNSNTPGGKFTKDNITFKYPPGWHITEEDDLDGMGYYISVEKAGFDESGLLTVTWITGSLDLDEYIIILQEEFENQDLMNDLVFQDIRDNQYNGNPSISCDFSFSTLGIEHKGTIHILSQNDFTYSIVTNQAIEDITKNQDAFNFIESNFIVK